MKKVVSALLSAFFCLLLLASCEPKEKSMGEVTVDGTFIFVANPCPKGQTCLPGMEVALSAGKTYFLNNINVVYEEEEGNNCFVLDDNRLSETDKIRIQGVLFRYVDIHDRYYYRINVNNYQLLNK